MVVVAGGEFPLEDAAIAREALRGTADAQKQ
jgi:hypothetical protein